MNPEDRYLQPPILTNWPYLVKGYRGAAPTQPHVIVDGIGDLEWRVWSLFVGFYGPDGSDVVPNGPPKTAVNAGVNLQLQGLLDAGGTYERRFTLAPRRSLVFDTSAFRDVRLSLISTVAANIGLDNYRIVANATNTPIQEVADREYYLFEAYSQGTYAVPPGAIAVAAFQTADPAFEWRSNGFGFVAAAAAGGASLVRGTEFLVSVASMRIVWRLAQ
jgi:hypothetical protein